ncbi:MAG: hypothetical protein ACFCVD_08055 [Nodosilinea sp.]
MATNPRDTIDYSQPLQALMQTAQIPSYRALAATAGISRWSVDLLRRGRVGQLRVEVLGRLSHTLGVPVPVLIAQFGEDAKIAPLGLDRAQSLAQVEPLRQEYERLQAEMEAQAQVVRQQMQGEAIAILESWLLQWPTAVYAVQQNESLPATRLIPLTKPLDRLLQAWDMTPIGSVGAEVPYDPQQHQPMGAEVSPGQPVRIRYVGYRQGDRLLYRAKVSASV